MSDTEWEGAGWRKDSRHSEQQGQRPGGRHKLTELKSSKEARKVGRRQRDEESGRKCGASC